MKVKLREVTGLAQNLDCTKSSAPGELRCRLLLLQDRGNHNPALSYVTVTDGQNRLTPPGSRSLCAHRECAPAPVSWSRVPQGPVRGPRARSSDGLASPRPYHAGKVSKRYGEDTAKTSHITVHRAAGPAGRSPRFLPVPTQHVAPQHGAARPPSCIKLGPVGGRGALSQQANSFSGSHGMSLSSWGPHTGGGACGRCPGIHSLRGAGPPA